MWASILTTSASPTGQPQSRGRRGGSVAALNSKEWYGLARNAALVCAAATLGAIALTSGGGHVAPSQRRRSDRAGSGSAALASYAGGAVWSPRGRTTAFPRKHSSRTGTKASSNYTASRRCGDALSAPGAAFGQPEQACLLSRRAARGCGP